MTSDREKRENSVITSELDEQEQDGLEIPPHQEAVSVKDQDPLPSSLLRYFEASRSRAAACEKLLLEDLDDENMENQNGFLSESSKNEKKQEKRYDEDMEICDLWQQREEDFQRELRKIIEAEKVHQMELELSLKRAHDVFEEELHLQQEHFGELQKRVEHERRMIEEQLKIRKEEDEEEKKNNEEKKQKEVIKGKRQEFEEGEWKKRVEMQLQEEGGKKETNEKWREDEDVVKKQRENGKKTTEDEVKTEEENREQQTQSVQKKMREQAEEEERKKKAERQKERVTNKKRAEKESKEEDEGKLLDVKAEERQNKTELGFTDKLKSGEEKERGKRGDDGKREKPWRTVRDEEETEKDISEEVETDLKRSVQAKRKETAEREEKLCESEEKQEDERSETMQEKQGKQRDKKMILQENKEPKNTEDMRFQQENNDDDDDAENMLKEITPQDKKSKHVDADRHENEKLEEEILQKEGDGVNRTNGGRDGKEDAKNKVMTVMMITEAELQPEKERKKSPDPTNNIMSGSSTTSLIRPQTGQQWLPESVSSEESTPTATEAEHPAAEASAPCWSALAERTEQKRLSWREGCVSWSTLSLQNRSRPKGSVQSQRRPRRKVEADRLPPLCTDSLLQVAGQRSLQEVNMSLNNRLSSSVGKVTIVALEKLPSCSLSSLVQCSQLRSLTLRRCGLKSLEGIKQLQELSYVDLRENDISYVDCANMTSLRVLRLSHNKLTSIHGLNGAENLDVLELSYNSITRVAGLESLRRLQRLLLDHNHLINTRGLKDVCTLLHLNCASNHLEAVEGLESSTLLHSLDLRANNLTDPPSLNNQVLLRELHLDDNCICSLQGLADCWLPLLQNLSASQNRMTQLPSMMDFISLEHLDLRFNCLSEVLDVCENLQGCPSLCEVWLSGNPLLQERGWRCVLQKAVPGLKAIDGQLTDSSMSASPAPRVISAPGSFLSICREQLQQTQDLQQLHSTELSDASPHLDAVSSLCQHHTLALKLAEEQRLFHENAGATPSSEKPNPKPAPCGKTLYTDSTTAERCYTEEEPSHETIAPNREVIEEDAHEVRRRRTSKGFTCGISFPLEKVPTHHNSDFKRLAAVVIQQRWRKYRQRLKNTTSTVKRTEDNEEELEHVPNNKNTVAATVIQAFWRGFTLRRKLASALAAVECPDGEDDTFEEEEEEFVFDEPNLDKNWTDFEDSSPRYCPVPELKLPPFGPSSYISSHTWSPFQAWTAGEHGDSASQKDSPETSNRSKSPPSTFAASGVSERSERILEEWGFTDRKTALLMLKRAQRMKSTTEERRQKNPSVRLELFRNQLGPVKAQSRPAPLSQLKVSTAKLGLQQLERTEPRGHMQSQRLSRHMQSPVTLVHCGPAAVRLSSTVKATHILIKASGIIQAKTFPLLSEQRLLPPKRNASPSETVLYIRAVAGGEARRGAGCTSEAQDCAGFNCTLKC
ncbi:uncharacterized protein lrriq1 isoform X3 [Oryzias latipes]